MFAQKECRKCHQKYDKMEQVCPFCDTPDENSKQNLYTNNSTYLPFIKQIVLFLLGSIGFTLIGLVIELITKAMASGSYVTPESLEAFMNSVKASAIINFTTYLILFILIVSVLWGDSVKLVKKFKSWLVPVSAIVGFLAIIAFNLIYQNILLSVGINIVDNANENIVTSIVKQYPLISLIVFGIIGPICEEVTYRVGLYSFFKRINVYLAFVITVVVFAFIHFDYQTTNLTNEFLNMPYYLFAAFVFTFIYERFGFAASVSAHVTNNLISVLSTIIVMSVQ